MVCTPQEFGCDWQKIGCKSKCRKDSERIFLEKGGVYHEEAGLQPISSKLGIYSGRGAVCVW